MLRVLRKMCIKVGLTDKQLLEHSVKMLAISSKIFLWLVLFVSIWKEEFHRQGNESI